MPQKIENQKYLKISKGMKNVRIPHILCTLQILYLFEVFKIGLLHLEGGQMISKKIQLQKY